MAATQIELAASPTSWGVHFAEHPDNPAWRLVLDEIKASGLRALELGPVGYLTEDPATLREALATRSLTAVGSFVFESLHDPASREHVLAVTKRACTTIAAAGGNVLVIIDRPGRERAATAGRSQVAARLSEGRWMAMIEVVKAVADIAREHDLLPACHPHAGSYVEFADEIGRFLESTDIGLCLDTGHAAYAGIRAEEAIANYASRLVHVHLKDTNPRVLDRVRRERLGFWEAIGRGVFCPLGQGEVDLSLTSAALDEIGYTCFATIEQDRVPGAGNPLNDLKQSLGVLAAVGIGSSLRLEPKRA